MKRLAVWILFFAFLVGGSALAQEKEEKIVWVHLDWVARNGNAKGCVQMTTPKKDLGNTKKENDLIEVLMRKAQEACAASEKAKPGRCPRGEAMGSGGEAGLGEGACP